MISLSSTSLVPEPPYQHGTTEKVGVLLVNLGTPEAPTSAALKKYLREFLSDPRVVEIPRLLWWPILNLVILNVRPKRSAEKYASIWTKNGSPLKVNSENQRIKVSESLSENGLNVVVSLAMRYGDPSIKDQISMLKKEGVSKLLILPLYPQFSASTTATVFDKVFEQLIKMRNPPAIRLVKSFHDSKFYISSVAESIRRYWQHNKKSNFLLFSFHGVPVRSLMEGDPYHCQCQKSARLIAEELQLNNSNWAISFQSRFGAAEWLKPYTTETIKMLAEKGITTLDIRLVKSFHDSKFYISSVAESIRRYWQHNKKSNFLLFSFHGVPVRSLMEGDPYHCQCQKSARLIAEELQLNNSNWAISFQSRFGAAEWLKPYTTETIKMLAEKGITTLDIVCPGFTSDCLETLEEIAMEAKEDFINAGGKNFGYIPCLNDGDLGIRMLKNIIVSELGVWGTESSNVEQEACAKKQRERALQLGAKI